MSTTPINCPKCNAILRVAVQPSKISALLDHIIVVFNTQMVAHTCKETK